MTIVVDERDGGIFSELGGGGFRHLRREKRKKAPQIRRESGPLTTGVSAHVFNVDSAAHYSRIFSLVTLRPNRN